jgi:hypothetical protein
MQIIRVFRGEVADPGTNEQLIWTGGSLASSMKKFSILSKAVAGETEDDLGVEYTKRSI